ncbi:MAG: sugar phosphate nucleotidyltransferase [Candidatus Geothermincolia bacterium]
MILAAGLGTRLRPLTEDISKPMVPIVNKPVMQHIVELLVRHGIREIFVNLHHFPDAIRGHFGDGKAWGADIVYSFEEELLGTAGGVKKLEGELAGGSFLIISGDALTDIDLGKLADFHRSRGALATMVLTEVDDPSKYGVVITEPDGRVNSFQEKPPRGTELSRVANSGIYMFEPEIFDLMPPAGDFYDFGTQLYPMMLERGLPLFGYEHDDYWNDVGSLEEYRRGNFDALAGRVRVDIPGVRIADDIWVGDGTVIEEGVLMVGPICVGDGCRVRAGAKLYGPLIIGDGTVIDSGALIYRGIKWGGGRVGSDASLLDCIVGHFAEIGAGAALLANAVIGHRSVIGERSVIHPSVRVMSGSVVADEEKVRPGAPVDLP